MCFVSLDGCRVTFPVFSTSDLILWPPRVPRETGNTPLAPTTPPIPIYFLEIFPLKLSIIVSSLDIYHFYHFVFSQLMHVKAVLVLHQCIPSSWPATHLSSRQCLSLTSVPHIQCLCYPSAAQQPFLTNLLSFFLLSDLKKKKNTKNDSTGGNYDSRFDVGKASGTLIVARPLDDEQKSNYNLTVEATDGTRTVSTQVIETLMKWFESWWGRCHGAVCLTSERSDGQ